MAAPMLRSKQPVGASKGRSHSQHSQRVSEVQTHRIHSQASVAPARTQSRGAYTNKLNQALRPIPVWVHNHSWCERELKALIDASCNAAAAEEGDWIEYFPGDGSLVIAAPHDGMLRPTLLPRRISGVMVRDTGTKGLAATIALCLLQRDAPRPHLLICHISRARLDVNRARAQAASDSLALKAWDHYHDLLHGACIAAAAVDSHHALFLDVHAQANFRFTGLDMVELGTLCPCADDLAKGPAHIEELIHKQSNQNPPASSDPDDIQEHAASNLEGFFSMPRLAASVLSHGGSVGNLLCGEKSLGALLRKRGYQAIPGPTSPIAPSKSHAAGTTHLRHTPRDSLSRRHTPRNTLTRGGNLEELAQAADEKTPTEGVSVAHSFSHFFCGNASYPLHVCHHLLDSLQLECPIRLTKEPELWAPFADALVDSLEEFWQTHLQQSLSGPCMPKKNVTRS